MRKQDLTIDERIARLNAIKDLFEHIKFQSDYEKQQASYYGELASQDEDKNSYSNREWNRHLEMARAWDTLLLEINELA